MTLTLYNTLTRRKEPFRPIDPANVRMYVCGPTVYDYAHIGNARPVIVFDVLFRLLRHLYGPEHVTYARNITDVDDKINARAGKEGVPIRELTERTLKQFQEDIGALGVLSPTVEPRATDYIRRSDNQLDMVRLIETLVQRGHAYVADDHVLFDVASMPDYGRFSNRSLEDMEAGARVDVAPYKKGPMDFVLWKPSKPGEPSWPSPSGITTPGRPGWHIECSAMAGALLGETFDIHGGGIDLVFPHHENEIAQSRCAHGTPVMANYWMHNGFLQVEDEKMSKSLGNFVTIRELLRDWPGEVLRLNMLKTHYRQPIDWTLRSLVESARTWNRWVQLNDLAPSTTIDQTVVDWLSDDLNTWEALQRLDRLFEEAGSGDEQAREGFAATARYFGLLYPANTFAFFPRDGFSAEPVAELVMMLRAVPSGITVGHLTKDLREKRLTAEAGFPDVLSLLDAMSSSMSVWDAKRFAPKAGELKKKRDERNAARKAKNFKEADRIRDELAAMGIQLKDAKDPATGEIKTTWEARASGATEVKR